MKRIVTGILAHVDAGKTTLSEGLLYCSGMISKLGRVDSKNTLLDNYSLERERGITIFSKQATITLPDTEIVLLDTPGHIDFSSEAERALMIQDYAILVVSATDGIQSHTKTLWNMLRNKNIPTFIFVNKVDISVKLASEIMEELKHNFGEGCVNFGTKDGLTGRLAEADEELLSEYYETDTVSHNSVCDAIDGCRIFPTYFGSALKLEGVSNFLRDFNEYTSEPPYNRDIFGAKIYKITRDKAGKKLAMMKITGGSLRTKNTLTLRSSDGNVTEEKCEEIRLYSADKYKSVDEAVCGNVCAVLGLASAEVGMGLGFEKNDTASLAPVLDYKILLPKDTDPTLAYKKLLVLSEEEPELYLSFDAQHGDIRVRLMGEIQLEVLKRIILERFNMAVDFGSGSILYKETIKDCVIGRGHFEPLRHYAEVHLSIEPGERGSGIVCASECSTDLISLNWQRLILTHIEEKAHRGVLTGAPVTDLKITLVAAKAHLKHTEGGDFRQATYRAIRQGLMKAESILLEPTFIFSVTLPPENLGRLMTDITNMHGKCAEPIFHGDSVTIEGVCPVLTMQSYATELRAYTKGEGKLTLTVGEYLPCHNPDEVIREKNYNPDLDERNTPNSVFCKNGTGYVVRWDEADEYMHLTSSDGDESYIQYSKAYKPTKTKYSSGAELDKELMAIFESTYGKIKPRVISEKKENSAADNSYSDTRKPKKAPKKQDSYIIVDAYNFIFASEELSALAKKDIQLARDALIRNMCDYSGFHRVKCIIVFDAYMKKSGEGSMQKLADVTVIFTKEGQTADAYIEKCTSELSGENTVRVVSSDMQEQFVILGCGGLRVSCREFEAELKATKEAIRDRINTGQ